ncbi:MAG: hypothetical protein AB7Q17_06105 [Phycisphaerae bacterium]
MKLAWQFHKIAAGGSVTVGIHMPGRSNVRKLLQAAKRRGLAPAVLEQVASAADEFDRLVATHAGDRSTFDSMVSAHGADDQGEGLTLRQKRAAFRANRHLRGAQAAVQLKSLILAPSDTPGMLDLVAIQGYHDLRRIRYDCPLVVSRVRLSDDDHAVRRPNWEPLGPSAGQDADSSLLGAFCSPNLPPFRAVRTVGDWVLGELAGHGVGNRSAVTCIDGYLARAAVPKHRDETNLYGAMLTWIPIPCEVLLLDLVVHEDALGSLNPVAGCYCSKLRESELPGAMESCDRLALNESVLFLGKGLPVIHAAGVARHAEMYAAVFEKLGWPSERFDVHRCRIAFPVMLSSVLVRFDLPPAPPAPRDLGVPEVRPAHVRD